MKFTNQHQQIVGEHSSEDDSEDSQIKDFADIRILRVR